MGCALERLVPDATHLDKLRHAVAVTHKAQCERFVSREKDKNVVFECGSSSAGNVVFLSSKFNLEDEFHVQKENSWAVTNGQIQLHNVEVGRAESTRLVRDMIARALPQYRSGYL